jgi:hypothetical protein
MSDKWIENTTGVCPVAEGTLVDIMYRCGEEYFAVPALNYTNDIPDTSECFWENDLCDYDITHWRLHKPEMTLEDAFDEPDSVHWTETIEYLDFTHVKYKYPTTKEITVTKKSTESLVSDNFNNLSGKQITEQEVVQIVNLFNLLKEMEK